MLEVDDETLGARFCVAEGIGWRCQKRIDHEWKGTEALGVVNEVLQWKLYNRTWAHLAEAIQHGIELDVSFR